MARVKGTPAGTGDRGSVARYARSLRPHHRRCPQALRPLTRTTPSLFREEGKPPTVGGKQTGDPMDTIHTEIVEGLVAEMEAGVLPWRKPWSDSEVSRDLPANGATGRPYSGVNILLLWSASTERGYTDHRWVTFNQAKAFGGVRKGERGTRIVFATQFVPQEERRRIAAGETTEERARRVWCLRRYSVFNLAQTRDAAALETVAATTGGPAAFLVATGADIRHGGTNAFYHHLEDFVQLPDPSRFESGNDHAATALHELAHWTGHPTRLDRPFGRAVTDPDYASEELIAELASAFLCSHLGIAQTGGQHASYIAYWLAAIRKDARYLFSAARQASAAAEFLQQRSAPRRQRGRGLAQFTHAAGARAPRQPRRPSAPIAPADRPPILTNPTSFRRAARLRGHRFPGSAPLAFGPDRARWPTLDPDHPAELPARRAAPRPPFPRLRPTGFRPRSRPLADPRSRPSRRAPGAPRGSAATVSQAPPHWLSAPIAPAGRPSIPTIPPSSRRAARLRGHRFPGSAPLAFGPDRARRLALDPDHPAELPARRAAPLPPISQAPPCRPSAPIAPAAWPSILTARPRTPNVTTASHHCIQNAGAICTRGSIRLQPCMTEPAPHESGPWKKGRPAAQERVLHVRVPNSLLPFLERVGHGSVEVGASICLASFARSEQRTQAAAHQSLDAVASAARSLQADREAVRDRA